MFLKAGGGFVLFLARSEVSLLFSRLSGDVPRGIYLLLPRMTWGNSRLVEEHEAEESFFFLKVEGRTRLPFLKVGRSSTFPC